MGSFAPDTVAPPNAQKSHTISWTGYYLFLFCYWDVLVSFSFTLLHLLTLPWWNRECLCSCILCCFFFARSQRIIFICRWSQKLTTLTLLGLLMNRFSFVFSSYIISSLVAAYFFRSFVRLTLLLSSYTHSLSYLSTLSYHVKWERVQFVCLKSAVQLLQRDNVNWTIVNYTDVLFTNKTILLCVVVGVAYVAENMFLFW